MKTTLFVLVAAVCSGFVGTCAEPPSIPDRVDVPQFDVVAHDPVILKEGEVYYLFTTGPGVSVWTSDDMELWTMVDPVFSPLPSWTFEEVSGFSGHLWAPDVSYRDGKYYLYYSVSTFGKNDSCIGLATNVTLDASRPDFEWVDEGIVVQSKPEEDDWNAIDPNLVLDEEGVPYLAWGSFWSGLKIAKMRPDMKRLADPEAEPKVLASRVDAVDGSTDPHGILVGEGNTAIEGPFIYRKGEFFYLFASVDYCCRGVESTYKMIFGRSKSVTGPFLDEEGNSLLHGGGTLLKEGDGRWQGVGHNSVCAIDGVEYAVFHGYDGATERGLPKLHVQELDWTEDGWPYLVESE